jgi:hypothetical protein
VVELIQTGAVGEVREVHVWVEREWGGVERPTERPPIPEGLHYGLWLGPAPERPYHPTYLPAGWRAWWDFGGGTLDLALARVMADSSPEIIGTRGILIGGDDFDSAIMGHSLLKHFGLGTTLGPKHLPFPPNLLAPLLHWQTIPMLASHQRCAYRAIKRQSNTLDCREPTNFGATGVWGFLLFQAHRSGQDRSFRSGFGAHRHARDVLQLDDKCPALRLTMHIRRHLVKSKKSARLSERGALVASE